MSKNQDKQNNVEVLEQGNIYFCYRPKVFYLASLSDVSYQKVDMDCVVGYPCIFQTYGDRTPVTSA